MANMFSGNREKQVPKTFKDCYKTDSVTNNLWLWAERLEAIGKIIAILTAIATFITLTAIGIGEWEYSLIFVGLIAAPVAAFLEYITFHIIALLVGSLASIVQHTKISANINLYEHSKVNNKKDEKSKSQTQSIIPKNQKINNKSAKKDVTKTEFNKQTLLNQENTIDNEKYISIRCPYCNEELEFSSDVIKPYCPYCEKEFNI